MKDHTLGFLFRYATLAGLLIWSLLWLALQLANTGSRLVVNRDVQGRLVSVYTVDVKTALQSQGRMLVYWPNGTVRVQAEFDKGVYVGEVLEWHENGIPARRMQYAFGREYGLQRGWRSDGGSDFAYEMQGGRRFGVPGTMPCIVSKGDRKMALARYLLEASAALTKPTGTRAQNLSVPGLPMFNDSSLLPKWVQGGALQEHTVNPQALQDHRAASFEPASWAGQPTIVSFFFTGCSNLCPTTIVQMKMLEARLHAKQVKSVRFVAVTVAPLQDDVPALANYAKRFELGDAWHLVTGDIASVERFAERSFFAKTTADVHTERAFLLDGDKRIRGVYNATQPADMARLIQDATKLATRPNIAFAKTGD